MQGEFDLWEALFEAMQDLGRTPNIAEPTKATTSRPISPRLA